MNTAAIKKSAGKKRPAPNAPAALDLYRRGEGVDFCVEQVRAANPMQMIEIERKGVAAELLADLAERIDVPASRLFAMLRVPKATAARKMAAGAIVDGRAGQAMVGLLKLVGIARGIVDDSTAAGAADFDALKWLGRWIELPQAALGGRKPADLLDTPTGLALVARVLGAIESGAYQ